MIATRRERETHFGANDRAMVMPIYFVCIALSQQKNVITVILCFKNVVIIAYRNIYYYKKYAIIIKRNTKMREREERARLYD